MSSSVTREVYYRLKPLLPWRLRIAARRLSARYKLKSTAATWPLDPAAAAPPPGWKGWPEGRPFALVLTHDVEGQRGLDQVRQLAELEMEFGVRSCFNFIPEGEYAVPPELRSWLVSRGFEVGIHDLRHDGRLYYSRAEFRRNAARINRYVREWQAAGFRSGFMLHELDWMHDLDIAYDSSTFDTDPFEPQPEAARTIFPFWVPPLHRNSGRPGYVELPYTLPQDSTLFLVLREATPDIWLRKLDWIVERGGMALVNVHPDYLHFGDSEPGSRSFPVAHYRRLLASVRERYGDRPWQPLPAQLAAWYKHTHVRRPAAEVRPLEGKRAAVLLYSYYPSDPRPRRAATALVEAGMAVDLLCLTENPSDPREETVDGVRIFRVPMRRRRGSKFAYLSSYARFIASAFAFLSRRGRYDVVHVHNMPDILVFAAWMQKRRGARVLLDLHDPMPELMMSIYSLPPGGWPVRLLRFLERRSIAFADAVFTPNASFSELFAARNPQPEKIHIVMNTPEERIFEAEPRPAPPRFPARVAGEFRVMHHGSIVHRHGLDLLVRAVAAARARIPGLQLDIYGRREPFLDEVLAVASELGIADVVRYHGNKTSAQISEAILETDLGVIPNRRSAFTALNFPTRIFEYLAMNRLVIVPDTKGITDYFAPDDLPTFRADDVDSLAERIGWIHDHPEAARTMLDRSRAIYRDHRWAGEKARLLDVVARTLSPL